ncbi:MAG: flagellar basal body rod protein FlgB, partial [Acetobacteraceae bacterium]
VRTDPRHLPGVADDDLLGSPAQPSGRAPDGNAVGLDAQLTKVADTQTAQELVTSVYKKYLDMFAMALGRGTAGS